MTSYSFGKEQFYKKPLFWIIIAVVVASSLALFFVMSPSELKGIFGSSGTAETAAPEVTLKFRGYTDVTELPVGSEEGCVGYAAKGSDKVGPAFFTALSDDEFVILNSVNKELIFINRNGNRSTVSLKDCCNDPKRVTVEGDKVAVLDAEKIIIMNRSGEVTRTLPIPYGAPSFYFGFNVFEYVDGVLFVQLYADLAYLLDDNGFLETTPIVTLAKIKESTKIVSRNREWIVKGEKPVSPVSAQGEKLLAMAYDGEDADRQYLVGVYYTNSERYSTAPIDTKDLAVLPTPEMLSISPSGRVYVLNCYEDHVLISEAVFENPSN